MSQLKYIPDRELIELANGLCEEFPNNLSEGEYESFRKKYTIGYVDIPYTTFSRVGSASGKIELNKKLLIKSKVHPDFVFFSILWCDARFRLKLDDPKTDIAVLEYFLTTGRDPLNVIDGWKKQMLVESNGNGLTERVDPNMTGLSLRVVKMAEFVVNKTVITQTYCFNYLIEGVRTFLPVFICVKGSSAAEALVLAKKYLEAVECPGRSATVYPENYPDMVNQKFQARFVPDDFK